MHLLFINLDHSLDRRTLVETNFAAVPHEGWTLERVPAVDASLARTTPGALRDAEKACFMSHRRAVERSVDLDDHVLIAEDDILLGRNSLPLLGRIVGELPGDQWDVLYPEIGVLDPSLMLQLMLLRRRLSPENGYILLELTRAPFFSATSYVVNRAAVERVSRLLQVDRLDVPYDLFLRQSIRDGRLKAKAVFPFATTVSTAADESTIQSGETSGRDARSHAFRRLVWAERSLDEFTGGVDAPPHESHDADVAALRRIWQTLPSERSSVP